LEPKGEQLTNGSRSLHWKLTSWAYRKRRSRLRKLILQTRIAAKRPEPIISRPQKGVSF
jgi:hypothetical protein